MVSLVSIYFLIWALSIQKVAPFVYIRNLVIVLYFFHMEHKENKSDSNMDVTCVYKILLCDENSKDLANKPENQIKLTNSPPKWLALAPQVESG